MDCVQGYASCLGVLALTTDCATGVMHARYHLHVMLPIQTMAVLLPQAPTHRYLQRAVPSRALTQAATSAAAFRCA